MSVTHERETARVLRRLEVKLDHQHAHLVMLAIRLALVDQQLDVLIAASQHDDDSRLAHIRNLLAPGRAQLEAAIAAVPPTPTPSKKA